MSSSLMPGALGGRRRLVALAISSLAVLALIWLAFFRQPVKTPVPVATLAVPEGQAGKAGEVLVTKEAMKLAEINIEPATIKQVQERLEVSGSIKTGGNQLAKITPPAPGKASKLLVAVGDTVRQGQVLALLDSAELARAQADYKQAQARSEALQSALASQRELARETGVSLGKLNYALRALIDAGWVKAGNFSRNQDKFSYAYLLTPSGIEAKARLTRAFLARKLGEYDRLRAEIEGLQAEVGDGR